MLALHPLRGLGLFLATAIVEPCQWLKRLALNRLVCLRFLDHDGLGAILSHLIKRTHFLIGYFLGPFRDGLDRLQALVLPEPFFLSVPIFLLLLEFSEDAFNGEHLATAVFRDIEVVDALLGRGIEVPTVEGQRHVQVRLRVGFVFSEVAFAGVRAVEL
jgi:hypothetical protein